MKPALLIQVALVAAAAMGSPTPAPPATCSVSGVVVKMEGSVPLPSSTVRLQSEDDHTRTFSSVTDAGGRFEIKGVDPGRYRLRVIRNGYISQEYGQRTPNDPGAILALSPSQDLKDLLFRLLPSAVIAGRIQNENGDPDFLKPFESKGQSISLQEGDGKSLELVAIQSASQEQEKQ
jgi:hypothetical protein